MAKAKQELTDTRVQGRPDQPDELDRLITMTMDIAKRNGLLDGPDDQAVEADEVGQRKAGADPGERRTA